LTLNQETCMKRIGPSIRAGTGFTSRLPAEVIGRILGKAEIDNCQVQWKLLISRAPLGKQARAPISFNARNGRKLASGICPASVKPSNTYTVKPSSDGAVQLKSRCGADVFPVLLRLPSAGPRVTLWPGKTPTEFFCAAAKTLLPRSKDNVSAAHTPSKSANGHRCNGGHG
jgi:hypothetical protein